MQCEVWKTGAGLVTIDRRKLDFLRSLLPGSFDLLGDPALTYGMLLVRSDGVINGAVMPVRSLLSDSVASAA